METQHYHELLRPLKELSREAIAFVGRLIIPDDVFDDFMDNRGAEAMLARQLEEQREE